MLSLPIYNLILTADRPIAPADVRDLQDLLTNAVFTGELSVVNQPHELGGYVWKVSRAKEAVLEADNASDGEREYART